MTGIAPATSWLILSPRRLVNAEGRRRALKNIVQRTKMHPFSGKSLTQAQVKIGVYTVSKSPFCASSHNIFINPIALPFNRFSAASPQIPINHHCLAL
jgi:hypothetical protein